MSRIVASVTTLEQHVEAVKQTPDIYRPPSCPHCGINVLWQHGQINPQLFPFHLRVSLLELRRAPRLAVHRQGIAQDVVALRNSSQIPLKGERGQLSLL